MTIGTAPNLLAQRWGQLMRTVLEFEGEQFDLMPIESDHPMSTLEVLKRDWLRLTSENARLRDELNLKQKQVNRLRYSIEPFARNFLATSLSDALGHITREELIQAAEVLAATGEPDSGDDDGEGVDAKRREADRV